MSGLTDTQGKLIALGGVLLEAMESMESAKEWLPQGCSPAASTVHFTMADGTPWKLTIEFGDEP